MKQIKTIIIINALLVSGFFSTVYSQQKWTLERCITYALENNIQIKQQELSTKVSKNALVQSTLDVLPSINGNADVGKSSGRALDQTTYQFTNQTITSSNLSASASITLFSGFQKLNTIRENEMNFLASLKDLEKLKNDISLNLAAAYLQIILNNELLQSAKNQLDITSQQVERTQKLVDAGSLPRASLLEIQSQAASQELQVVTAQNNLDLSYLVLIQFLELETVKDFEIEIPQIDIPENEEVVANVDSIYGISSTILPQIKSAEYRLSGAKRGLLVAKGNYSPTLSLSGTYYTGYSNTRQKLIGNDSAYVRIGYTPTMEPVSNWITFNRFGDYPYRDQLNDNGSSSVTLSLRVPIFNGWMVNRNVSNAKIAILNNEYNLENEKNILYKDIQQSYADAIASLRKYRASQKALESMEESFKSTQQRYNVGLVNTTDFNAAQNQLAITRSDLLISKYQYIFKQKILDFYQGKTITL